MRRALLALAALTAFALPAGSTIEVEAAPTRLATSRAVVIVDTGVGVHRTVIEFSGSVSGLGALQLAGANPETVDYGGSLGQAVCKLYGVGDPPEPGQCPNGWRYYRAQGGAGGWTYSGLGASNTSVHDGDVEGWGYGHAPPFSSFCDVAGCALPAPPPDGGGRIPGGYYGAPGGAAPGTPGGPPAPGPSATTAAPDTSAGSTRGTDRGGNGSGKGGHSARVSAQLASHRGDGGSPDGFIAFGFVLAMLIVSTVAARRIRKRSAAETAEPGG